MLRQLSWQTVGLVAVLGALALGLASLTHWDSGAILGLVGVLVGIGGGAAVAGARAETVDRIGETADQIHEETAAQTDTLGTIARRLNGDLDARIEAGAQRAADRVLDTLRAEGIIHQ